MEHYEARQASNGLGTAAMVLGIIALVLSLIPVIGFISWILAPLAIIFGLIAITKPNLPKGSGIAGVATGGVALVICVLWAIAFGAAISEGSRVNAEYSDRL